MAQHLVFSNNKDHEDVRRKYRWRFSLTLGKTQIIRKNRGRPQRYLQCYVLEKRAGHEVPCNTGIRKSVCTVRNIVDRLKRDDDKPLQDNHTLPSPPLPRQIPSELYLTRYLNNLVPSKRTLLIPSSLSFHHPMTSPDKTLRFQYIPHPCVPSSQNVLSS